MLVWWFVWASVWTWVMDWGYAFGCWMVMVLGSMMASGSWTMMAMEMALWWLLGIQWVMWLEIWLVMRTVTQ